MPTGARGAGVILLRCPKHRAIFMYLECRKRVRFRPFSSRALARDAIDAWGEPEERDLTIGRYRT